MSKQKQQPGRRPYQFVYAGQTVLYYEGGSPTGKPNIAFVEYVGDMAIDLMVRTEYSEYLKQVDGCRHVDEEVSEAIRLESGGWEHTIGTIRLYARAPELGEWPTPPPPAPPKKTEEEKTVTA